jgi:hypothetical protein
LNEYRPISSDAHVGVLTEAGQAYLSAEFRVRAPRIERTHHRNFTQTKILWQNCAKLSGLV